MVSPLQADCSHEENGACEGEIEHEVDEFAGDQEAEIPAEESSTIHDTVSLSEDDAVICST